VTAVDRHGTLPVIYRLAPMSAVMWVVTVALLAIPVVVAVAGLLVVGLALAVLYLWVWLWMRPRHFVIDEDAIEIVWPLRSRRIQGAELCSARTITAREFRREHGLAVRIGVGGLWGGFGLLWTRPKTFDMYVSRGDGLVILERDRARPLLITPERPEEFVRAAPGPSQDGKPVARR
jgi:hypothetical protein